jgi:hypothetical protein
MPNLQFLKATQGLADASVRKSAEKTVVLTLPEGADAQAIAKNIESLHPDAKVTINGAQLSILLPAEIKVGNEPTDLRKLAFTLKATYDAKSVGLTTESCCGNAPGSCCLHI